MITNISLVVVEFHLNGRDDSSWLICKLGQAYGEWDIDLVVLITRESDFSASDSHSDWNLVQFYLHGLGEQFYKYIAL